MDDFLDSLESESKTIQTADELLALLKLGVFKLTKFVSNIPNLALHLKNDTTKPGQKSLSITPKSKKHLMSSD